MKGRSSPTVNTIANIEKERTETHMAF